MQRPASRWIALVGAALPMLLAGNGLLAQRVTTRPTLALMNFTNAALTDREIYAPLEWSVPELLAYRLATNTQIDIVDRQKLQALLDEQGLGASGRVDQETAARMGRLLGAQYMVFGTVLLDRRNRLRIDARVLEVETSKLVHSETYRDANWDEDVSFALDSLAERLNRSLRLPGRVSLQRAVPERTDSARAAPKPTVAPATSTTRVASSSATPGGKSNGLLTLGRALRATGAGKPTQETLVMFRTAADETPSIAKDVEQILKKLSDGSP